MSRVHFIKCSACGGWTGLTAVARCVRVLHPWTIITGAGIAAVVILLALLWQIYFTPLLVANPFSAVRASLKRWSSDEFDDGVAHGWQAWLRRWPVDSFFPASLL